MIRHVRPGCVLCGRELSRQPAGRRRLYCGQACRQRAYRLREDTRRWRGTGTGEASPAEVARLLALVLRAPSGR